MTELINLPTEIIISICSFLNIIDLSKIRLVNKKLNIIVDQPLFWRHLSIPFFLPQNGQERRDKKGKKYVFKAIYKDKLWNIKDLKKIIDPHRKIIKSIKIHGVEDTIVRYILLQCHELEELILCGWITLSNNAFSFSSPPPTLKLCKLGLIGMHGFPNCTSVDAFVLTHLLLIYPIKSLYLNCQIQIHKPTLLYILKKNDYPCKLTDIYITTFNNNDQSSDQYLFFYTVFPCLQSVHLVPARSIDLATRFI
ncbi:unnamed protein product [Cunninghamella echinulata]